jgi:rod shape-determining protein MreC
LAVAVVMALGLIIADSRWDRLDSLRAQLAAVAYPIQWLAALPRRLLHDLDRRFTAEADLRERNALLEGENLALRGRLQRLRALETENRRLRDLLGSSFKLPDRVLVAELLRVDLDPYRQQVLVDKGAGAGLYPGQPVLDAHAVMGQVIGVNPFTATVLLITDPSHSLPVQVNRNGLRTIANGTGLINQLVLPHLPKNADVQVGDLLVTSGLGGVFPAGYPVARITRVDDDPNSRFATVLAEPTARLDRSHEVLLVWTPDDIERAAGGPVRRDPAPTEPAPTDAAARSLGSSGGSGVRNGPDAGT